MILEVLGTGGFGTVYLAQDMWLKKKVALKVPHRQSEDIINLLKEPQVQAALTHPNIVQVITAEKVEPYFFIVLEYVNGESLYHIIEREEKLSLSTAINYFRQICSGVQHAHEHNIIHRDLRPSNILITQDAVVKIADFGTSTWIEGAPYATTRIGSPPYMAPEQFAGKSTFVSDIYSLGCILYEMLTGSPPIVDANPFVIEKLAREGKIVPLYRANPAVPKEISSVCMKALKPDPSERFQSVSEIIAEIDKYLGRDYHLDSIQDIKERIRMREIKGQKKCWNCKKLISTLLKKCPYCGEEQT
ncbi:MAG: protein kinase domain-containing protein [Candidatus Aminicenantia bacterium]